MPDLRLRRLASLAAALALSAAGAAAAEMPPVPHYLGSESCVACHADASAAWAGSDHGLAWTEPTPANVLGDFDDASFDRQGVVTRFTRRGDAYVVETEDGAGQRRSFDVTGVAGIHPLQQYLVSPAPGRTQALDIAWDTERRQWYDLYPDQVLPPGDGLHWTGPYKSWEARCAECHATGYSRRYDTATRSYAPEMAEKGVGCEACHGPGEAHAAWAAAPGAYDAAAWPGLTAHGLTVDLAGSAEAQIQQCAGCHSRREAFVDGNPLPGTPYHDSYNLALLREGTYYADGQIDAEDYEYGSFLQARMYAQGVRCSDCHEPHSMQLRAEGNAVCTQCHSPAGNDRFPTLRKALYDDPSHHFHTADTPAAECKSCHMPEKTYMGIDRRRDHGFRVPRPDLDAETGAPDTCTSCHTDRDPAWAAAELAARFPESTHRGAHFSTALAAARRDPAARADELVALAGQPDLAGIVRATALDLLVPVADPSIADRTAPLLADPDPLVRATAAALQRGVPDGAARLERLAPTLADPLRSVRIAGAKAMLGADPAAAPAAERAALADASAEWQRALASQIDFPETNMQVGGAALASR
ncbi:MAG TPA: cytochrome c3 family protein, partial [Amaricoccus sp.]|nr:cytochrome c3 family protein [Amaricoccus sp.]